MELANPNALGGNVFNGDSPPIPRLSTYRVEHWSISAGPGSSSVVEGLDTTFNLTGGTISSSGGGWLTQGGYCGSSPGAINTLASSTVSTISASLFLYGGGSGATITTAAGTVPSGIDLNISGAITDGGSGLGITKAGAGVLALTGVNTYTGATTINAGTLQLGTGGSLGNTAISFGGTGTFAVKPGSSTAINAGTTGAGSAGATLNLGGQTFDMGDNAISTFDLQQQTSFSGAALTITSGATLKFDLGGSTTAADLLAVTGSASVSGTVNVTVNTIGSTALSPATYNIITAASGLSGTWQFTGGGTRQTVTLGGTRSNIHLNNASTAVSLQVVNAYAVTYNGNGSDGGTVPTDSTYYDSGASVTVASVGTMTKSGGYTFNGWNTHADGSGTAYSAGSSFNISSDTTLNAQWVPFSGSISTSGTLSAFSTTYGTASSAQTFTVSGTSITGGILVTARQRLGSVAGWQQLFVLGHRQRLRDYSVNDDLCASGGGHSLRHLFWKRGLHQHGGNRTGCGDSVQFGQSSHAYHQQSGGAGQNV